MTIDNVVAYFNGDKMAADVWCDKYQMKDQQGNPVEELPSDMHRRMAKEFARVEFDYIKKEQSNIIDLNRDNFENLSEFGKTLMNKRTYQSIQDIEDEFFFYFDKFKQIIPQGSIMANLGNKYVVASLSNCFGIAPPHDSYAGIMKTDETIAHLQKRRGGVGAPLDTLRPKGSIVNNVSKTSTGIVAWAERFSNTTREVAQDGRRGALMLLLSCKHPEIFNFVTMKDDRTKVTGANVTTMLTDEFMKAVNNKNDNFICRFPTNADIPNHTAAIYDILPYNKIVTEQNNVTKVSVMKIHAKELFDLIAEMAWKNGEPGVAFIDRIINYSPDGVYELYRPRVANPCGEQWFGYDETCRLIIGNFLAFIRYAFTRDASIDLALVYELYYIQQRLGDNLVDLEVEYIDKILNKIKSDPEPEEVKKVEFNLWTRIKEKAKNGRRTGGGFTGLGDMLAALNLKYDSNEALQVVEKVMKVKMEAELDATIDMAILRGAFTEYEGFKEFQVNMMENKETKLPTMKGKNSFFQMLTENFPKQSWKMYKYGRRNISWSNLAPGGSVSILTQTTSSGEPVFKAYYIRRRKVVNDAMKVDFIDQNGDKWQEYAVLHPQFKNWINKTYPRGFMYLDKGESITSNNVDELPKYVIQKLFTESPWYGSEANSISWEKRVDMQAIIQKYTSNAISSTINLPKDILQDVVKQIYLRAYEKGLKGVTVYRDGSRSGVLISEPSKIKTDIFGYTDSIKRPIELDADYRFTAANKKEYAVIVGLLEGKPYEVFAFPNPNWKGNLKGKLIKEGKGSYKFKSEEYVIPNVQLSNEHEDEKILTRMVSGMLRHGMNPRYIVEQIDKCDTIITRFNKALARVLKHYIPDETIVSEACSNCGEKTIIREEGCLRCTSCGYSKC